jgi:alpha-L-rhamnosidase
MINRRKFLRNTAIGSASLTLPVFKTSGIPNYVIDIPAKQALSNAWDDELDLAPAKWIWYPSSRCLQNTVVLFRKEFTLEQIPESIIGWIFADSRYKLYINGQYVQWGPAPYDPRWPECDPLQAILPYLQKGKNVLAIQVLFFGQGDGTWAMGKCGMICRLELQGKDSQTIVSDNSWHSFLARAWKPGQFKRWYLRAFQEDRDNRLYPQNWSSASFEPSDDWRPAMDIGGNASKPSICTNYYEYLWEIFADPNLCSLRRRSVAMLNETEYPVKKLTGSLWLSWKFPAEDYFESLSMDTFDIIREPVTKYSDDFCEVGVKKDHAAVLTFELDIQMVGWPKFSVNAPEGTIIELLVHEAHQPGGPALMNSHFNSWTRFTCKEGWNDLETFDFESFRWVQLHIRNYTRPVQIRNVGIRRRAMALKDTPLLKVNDDRIQKVINAGINTLFNCAQDTAVDGMARERQQYSGDGSHQLHAVYSTFGDISLPGRFVHSFGQGLMIDGYFFDSWPGYDRMARTMERQLGLTAWGPILDHSVGFCFDCWYYYLYTGDLGPLHQTFPNLLVFFNYLAGAQQKDGLLPVENLGLPCVYIDNDAYEQQRHKICAYNLYIAAMCENALSPLCDAFGNTSAAQSVKQFGQSVLKAVLETFWNPAEQCFVINLPWLKEDGHKRYCDRSLSTAILFNQFPGGKSAVAIDKLKNMPPDTGRSYPCNAIWRYWALAKSMEIESVFADFRTRWYEMTSVQENDTIQESWKAEKDSGSQFSHCAVAPLIIMHMGVAGIQPTSPGYKECIIKPQFGSLENVEIASRTIHGTILLSAIGKKGNRSVKLEIPAGITAQLVLPASERIDIKPAGKIGEDHMYLLKGPVNSVFKLSAI